MFNTKIKFFRGKISGFKLHNILLTFIGYFSPLNGGDALSFYEYVRD